MLILLFIYLFKSIKSKWSWVKAMWTLKKVGLKIIYIIFIVLLSSAVGIDKGNNTKHVIFNVFKKDVKIGYVAIEKKSLKDITTYKVYAEVNAKVILNFRAVSKEKVIYKNDTLIYSSIKRKLNNKIKINQSTEFKNGNYAVRDDKIQKELQIKIINWSLPLLYFNEPIGVSSVYLDKYRKKAKITCLAPGKYKIVFPKDGFAIFHYEYGSCKRVDVVGSFYKVQLKPVRNFEASLAEEEFRLIQSFFKKNIII